MKKEFIPSFRFVICSDSHIEGIGSPGYCRLKKTVDYAFAYASENEAYGKVDMFFLAGDITNKGTKEEFDAFKEIYDYAAQKGGKFLCTVAKGHDSITMGKKSLEYYEAITGQEPNFHRVIGGYHFIGVSTSKLEKHFNTLFQKQWLKKELDKAVADTPDKPVFLMHHEHIKYTVYGSYDEDGWGKILFADLLKKYPNVVDFSGHSHYPVNDPRSVWQNEYTAVGTGSLKYTELTVDGVQKVHPEAFEECANFLIVEADKNSDIRILGIDILAEKVLCEYYFKNPADKNNREYTIAKQSSRSRAPVFCADAEVTVKEKDSFYSVTFPKAESTDGMPVFIYRIYAENSKGETVKELKTIPTYYLYEVADTQTVCLGRLDAGTYKIKVCAETPYGIRSDFIEKTIEV